MNPEQITIMVVDDDREMASLLCDILREAHYKTLSAKSGIDALTSVAQESPDLLISDLRMTGMDGHQLQLELKRVAPSCRS